MFKLILIADIHGNFNHLAKVVHEAPPDYTIIQIGDFGIYPQLRKYYIVPERPIYFLEGNHEHFPSITPFDKVAEIWANTFHIPRGYVMEINGQRVAFCGGGDSVDKGMRVPNIDWFAEEIITELDVLKFVGIGKIDLLITHAAPQSIVDRHFNPKDLNRFGLPETWKSPSAIRLDRIWELCGKCQLIAGHMHQSVVGEGYRILDQNEVYFC